MEVPLGEENSACSDWSRCSVLGPGTHSGPMWLRGLEEQPKAKPGGSKGAPYWACRGASMGAVRLREVENWTEAKERGKKEGGTDAVN